MKTVLPEEAFIIKTNHTVVVSNSVLDKKNSITFWNPIKANEATNIFFGNSKEYKSDLIYYEQCYSGRLYYTPLLFSQSYGIVSIPLFTLVINTKINSLPELLRFPFRDNQFPYYSSKGEEADILSKFNCFQSDLRNCAMRVVNRETDTNSYIRSKIKSAQYKAYINYYDQEFSNDKLFNLELDKEWGSLDQRNKDPQFAKWLLKPVKITVFEGWESYLYWELLSKVEGDFSISACERCGYILNIKKGGHRDRSLCKRQENIVCWRLRQRIKKARQRQFQQHSS